MMTPTPTEPADPVADFLEHGYLVLREPPPPGLLRDLLEALDAPDRAAAAPAVDDVARR